MSVRVDVQRCTCDQRRLEDAHPSTQHRAGLLVGQWPGKSGLAVARDGGYLRSAVINEGYLKSPPNR